MLQEGYLDSCIYAFIYSRLKYGIEVYGTCADYLINKLQVMQNKLLNLLLRLHPRTSTNDLHRNLNVLKLNDIYQTNTLAFVNECLVGNCPVHFRTYFKQTQRIYNYRNTGRLVIPRCRTVIGSSSCFVNGARLWNSLDRSVCDYKFKKC